ncbi:MAG: squalene/phytoene synthase family protein [Deltaproteobacteria bacterium]|nr:squalene/phytoene synthase family protein [Deltaproteobacteria bacterium]
MDPVNYCIEALKKAHSNMAAAILSLPGEQRNSLVSFYAFCRAVDDAADCAGTWAEKSGRLRYWTDEVNRSYGRGARETVMKALAPALAKSGVPKEWLLAIIEGVSWDLDKDRYESFTDLYAYCYRVAGVVGLVCTRLLGFTGRDVDMYAENLGIAMQLTNILRDVSEDAARGRIYLPLEDLHDNGVSEQDLVLGRNAGAVYRLMMFEIARAREYYRMAKASLEPSKRRAFYFGEILREIYSSLLDRVEERSALSPKVGQARPPALTKAKIAVKRRLIAALVAVV